MIFPNEIIHNILKLFDIKTIFRLRIINTHFQIVVDEYKFDFSQDIDMDLENKKIVWF